MGSAGRAPHPAGRWRQWLQAIAKRPGPGLRGQTHAAVPLAAIAQTAFLPWLSVAAHAVSVHWGDQSRGPWLCFASYAGVALARVRLPRAVWHRNQGFPLLTSGELPLGDRGRIDQGCRLIATGIAIAAGLAVNCSASDG